MNEVDNKTIKVALISLVIALAWSTPAIKALSQGLSTPAESVISVLIRTLIVFAFIRFIIFITKKK